MTACVHPRPAAFLSTFSRVARAGEKFQGTGLGLALTKRFVEARGATVGVRSAAGKGGVLFVVLPRISPFCLLRSK